MLVELSVSNYRSIRERQTLSMVAAPRLRKKDCVIEVKLDGNQSVKLLKAAAIYGPNASGKSNLVEATQLVRKIITSSNEHKQSIPVTPFRFDEALADKASEIEIHFICGRKLFEFRLAITKERVIEEQLFVHTSEEALYSRTFQNEKYDYKFGSALEGTSELHTLWANVTSSKHLFIAQAVQNSSEEFTQLQTPYQWLQFSCIPVNNNVINGLSGYIRHEARENPDFGKKISNFLYKNDVPITKIEFDVVSKDVEEELKSLDSDKDEVIEKNIENTKTTLTHRTALGEADFDFEEESMGTQNLLGFWLPWNLMSLKDHRTLIVDELDASLHPNIVANLVEQHIKENENSQLIFTTHDTHLMDTKILRRDQLWITERDINGATRLTSIYEYEGRESEDVEKRYYEGRYRGLPILRKRH